MSALSSIDERNSHVFIVSQSEYKTIQDFRSATHGIQRRRADARREHDERRQEQYRKPAVVAMENFLTSRERAFDCSYAVIGIAGRGEVACECVRRYAVQPESVEELRETIGEL